MDNSNQDPGIPQNALEETQRELLRVLGMLRDYYNTTDEVEMSALWTEIEGGIELALIATGWTPEDDINE